LMYCVERIDGQPMDQALPAAGALEAVWRPELLHGVQAIRGTWSNGAALLAIPYYARLNRNLDPATKRERPMSMVWMREAK
jgi:uncharacterized protein